MSDKITMEFDDNEVQCLLACLSIAGTALGTITEHLTRRGDDGGIHEEFCNDSAAIAVNIIKKCAGDNAAEVIDMTITTITAGEMTLRYYNSIISGGDEESK